MKQWRTLLRLEETNPPTGYVSITVPGWDPHTSFLRSKMDLPWNVRMALFENQAHFHAQVNLDAERVEDLNISDWEVPEFKDRDIDAAQWDS